MHAVVNKLTLGKPIDAALIRLIDEVFAPPMRQAEGFLDLKLVQVSDTEAYLVVLFATHDALVEHSRNIAAPLFAEHVRPYLGGAVQRSVGEVVAHVASPVTSKHP